MNQATLCNSRGSGGNRHMSVEDRMFPHIKLADGQQNIPLFQTNMPVSEPHFQPDQTHFSASVSQFFQSFEGDRFNNKAHGFVRNFHRPYSLYKGNAPEVAHQSNDHNLFQIPHQADPPACVSPESLLDVILAAQQKLQQLQDIVELMIQVGGNAQQQQSLAAAVESIMAQLLAASTNCLRQQPLQQTCGVAQTNGSVESRFEGLNDKRFHISLPEAGYDLVRSEGQIIASREIDESVSSSLSDSQLLTTLIMDSNLIKTRGKKRSFSSVDPQFEQCAKSLFGESSNFLSQSNTINKQDLFTVWNMNRDSYKTNTSNGNQASDERHSNGRDDTDGDEGENLPSGSYELVEMPAAEILAEHTHFCGTCGKGFKRAANLRMHMRGHGDEFKSLHALARPGNASAVLYVGKRRRYSCPFIGCKRNKQHKKFQPLKTLLCVKNHYRRSHCPKMLTCSRCKTKKFSVVADLKTHEKHCGEDKWQCSCGTRFSRKDKLTGHVNLFAGHFPATSSHEPEIVSSQNEPPSSSLTSEKIDSVNQLQVSKATTSLDCTASTLTAFQCSDDNLSRTPQLPVMDDDLFLSDELSQCQVLGVHHGGDKPFLMDNHQRGSVELLQHYD
ncbi:hypothetical protein KP509_39G029900 [Ceratopteris richardii]|uniref:C2H2-type domain-containing protein n=1 Tax=Ceratopteris richardii TaxID=49495 RepID=A0A8T2Q0J0_CERRI|nr:hypothetical protein KP509_39G029900 [Ceratopteris richardii]